MKILFIIILVIVSFFILIFVTGMVAAAFMGREKNRQSHAVVLLGELPEDLIQKLSSALLAHKLKNVMEINNIIGTIDASQLDRLLALLGPENRPVEFSSGKIGDRLAWSVMEKALQEKNYSVNSSKIITGIIHHDLDKILMEMHEKG